MRSSRGCERSAITLIEVLAGLVLVSALLAFVVVASGRFAVRVRRANDRLEAAAVLEEQLVAWYASAGRLPLVPEGRIAAGRSYRWRIWRLEESIGSGVPARRVRVELYVAGESRPAVELELLEPVDSAGRVARGRR